MKENIDAAASPPMVDPDDPPAAQARDGYVAFRWFGATPRLTLSLPEQIAARIGDRIIDGTYAPGERLVEQDLAAAFAVSRGPIREGLRLLEKEGLVRIHARRGAEVTRLSAQEVAETFEVRAGLFAIVSRRLAERRDPVLLRNYRAAVEELARHVDDVDGTAYAETVFRASLMSARACGNARLADLAISLSLQTLRYTRLSLASVERRRRSLALWQAALAALEAGDADAAEAASRGRIEDSMRGAIAALAADATA
ncbi:GntR family transcriptional regulator [Reyranella sp. CPCC 100927]|uniref:GntR family transcriptional regulator n=1 Tax=Reyranella sp. CPCC 100927 TaxID=2599616 RepID=UPI0011B4DD0D|nr:GntR family transcriptional regulator [Reyranella sp. CPCC 100927]TWT15340.1 GntR family transcriptional regulator [Reyranella sp. CPCC 100927]